MECESKTPIIPPKDDPEYCSIKEGVDFMEFAEYMKDKDIFNIRLPLNNKEAYRYLRWLNAFHLSDDDGNYINYILNIWSEDFTTTAVRPPTPREVAIFNSRHMIELVEYKGYKNESDRAMDIDFAAGSIRDAYRFWSYPDWIRTGLAGCVMKWGTFEDNFKAGDEFVIYEEWMK